MKKSGGGSWVKDVSGMMNIHSIGPHLKLSDGPFKDMMAVILDGETVVC